MDVQFIVPANKGGWFRKLFPKAEAGMLLVEMPISILDPHTRRILVLKRDESFALLGTRNTYNIVLNYTY